jgi:hypothetical protein
MTRMSERLKVYLFVDGWPHQISASDYEKTGGWLSSVDPMVSFDHMCQQPVTTDHLSV